MTNHGAHCALVVGALTACAPVLAQTANGESQTTPTNAAAGNNGPDSEQPVKLAPISVEGKRVGSGGRAIEGYVAERSTAATKTDTPLIETPMTVSVVASDQIMAQSADSVREVLRYVGGVLPEIRGNVASRYTQVTLRGFTPRIFLNGLILQQNYYLAPKIDPYLLQRVEVIKGPASVLYGLAPPGGLINLVSKRPTEESIREFRVQFGSDERAGIGFDIGGSLDEDGDLLYRVVATGFRRDGPQTTVETAHYSIAPSLTWRISDTTDITFLASYREDPKSGAYGALPASGTVFPNPEVGKLPVDFYDGDPNFESFDRKQTLVGYEFSHWFNAHVRFQQHFRYQHSQIDYKSVYGTGLAPNDPGTLTRGTAASEEELDGFAVDNQLQIFFDTGAVSHTLLLGLNYRNGDAERDTGFGPAPPLDLANPVYGQPITEPDRTHVVFDRDQIGFYIQDQIKIGNWVALLGGRYDSVQIVQTNENGGRQSRTDHAFTTRAGLLYHFDNGIAPFISYSESFQPPSAFAVRAAVPKPTEGEQYEAGVKYQPPGTNLLLTGSVFEITQTNVPTPDPNGPPGTTVQTGEVRIRGAGIEARASLFNGLDFSAAITYLDSQVTEANDGTAGNAFGQTPEFTGSLWLDYTTPSGPWKGFGIGFGIRHISDTYATNANNLEVDSYTIADLALHYDLGGWKPAWRHWRVALNVQNLFGTKHVTSCFSPSFCFYGYGREITATVAYAWE